MFTLFVHFAVGATPQKVASFTTLADAMRRAREYQGADARRIYISTPAGDVEVPVR